MESPDMPIDLTTPQIKMKRRSSFFNIDSNSTKKVETHFKMQEYREKLEREKLDWVTYIHKAHEHVKQLAKKEYPVYDSSILKAERREYLSGAIDLIEYLKEQEEFARKTLIYCKKKEFVQKRLNYCQQEIEDKILDLTTRNLSAMRKQKQG